MQLRHLTLTHIRAFSHAEITFQPGMNLIVGINGVGKSTILDAVRIMLSQVLPKFTAAKSSNLAFNIGDITIGQEFLTANLLFHAINIDFRYLVQQQREEYGYVSDSDENLEDEIERLDRRLRIEERRLKDRSYTVENLQQLTSNPEKIPNNLKSAKSQPLALYFSPHRSLTSMKAPKKGSGQALAFLDALTERELQPRAFAEWMIVQDALIAEDPQKGIQRQTLKQAVEQFLPGCANLRAISEPEPTLVIDKAGKTIDIRQLSDGERSMLALVMDLARRLSIANPNLEDPRQAQAVVLIDELDLHLHPQWQRTIVTKLTTTFPNCQFIATTHSPLIIGEVQPSGLTLLSQDDRGITVMQPGLQGFGLDSSWILQHLMGTESRNPETQAQIDRVEAALEEGDLDLARQQLDQLKTMIHGNDDEVIRLEASINNLEALADAMDTEAE